MNKDELLLESLKNIDLSPTMEENARRKYKAVSEYLENHGLLLDFYPQGSFKMGTVIRPRKESKDGNYDLDILAITKTLKSETTPRQVKESIGQVLKFSDRYRSKLAKEDVHCWTLQYAEDSAGFGFNLDLVPSVKESTEVILLNKSLEVPFEYADKLIAITQKNNDQYDWKTSNSLGFSDWFLDNNRNFLTNEVKERRKFRYRNELLEIYGSVERIPDYQFKTNLQRAIQIAKRHRDIYYERSYSKDKPSSMLLTALITDAVKESHNLTIEQILLVFCQSFLSEKISIQKDSKILNPVDPNENLIQSFNTADLQRFHNWVIKMYELILENNERTFKQSLNKAIDTRIFVDVFDGIKSVTPVQPWRVSIEE